ncbi:hormogonium polysaccharide secretion pseudopilin HpsC [Brasilonema sp. UFV-L1]|uniref:hormogonium polysaccharide secretion pseudopilin HpsC n=1 Tax=Brasilonema sp. UFV-L1 TaxID=2234130 RepID=UPI00145E7D40|nr:hormogonium polysaccharide secretion pseudopilin HpsC [Brasilonema sp. UFV-L1]NMG10491.1 prepilin-type cleavage/methylation domain-containing protein [Brasilonema sp. UFV-L1]
MTPIKWLFIKQWKLFINKQKCDGFTLIELLVGIVIATIVITPLLGLMVDIITVEQQEQAEANTKQEMKAALDYIARDLKQSVYIYDADGINAIRNKLPRYGDKNIFFPVLVFWKREFMSKEKSKMQDDTFFYSLVAYYLITENNFRWSKAARIGRFQISDGYEPTKTNDKDIWPDKGFQMFNLEGSGNLKSKMNQWKRKKDEKRDKDEPYTQDIVPLIDYIDQTRISENTNPAPPNCTIGYQQVPQFSKNGINDDAVATGKVKTRGFYVCVDSQNILAEVYLRGNALARLQKKNIDFKESHKTYFPQLSMRVQGSRFLLTK